MLLYMAIENQIKRNLLMVTYFFFFFFTTCGMWVSSSPIHQPARHGTLSLLALSFLAKRSSCCLAILQFPDNKYYVCVWGVWV